MIAAVPARRRPSVRAARASQAKFFTESRLLQQDVKVVLEGVSNKLVVASVLHPNGNIAEVLVREGLAKVVDWSITLVTGGPAKLRDLEKYVDSSQRVPFRLWHDALHRSSDHFPRAEWEANWSALALGGAAVADEHRQAKQSQVRLWKDYKPKAELAETRDLTGKVREWPLLENAGEAGAGARKVPSAVLRGGGGARGGAPGHLCPFHAR